MHPDDVPQLLDEAGPLLELLLQHLQSLFGGEGGAPQPAGLAFVCTDRQREPAAAAAIIAACWRALALRQACRSFQLLCRLRWGGTRGNERVACGAGRRAEGEGPHCPGQAAHPCPAPAALACLP